MATRKQAPQQSPRKRPVSPLLPKQSPVSPPRTPIDIVRDPGFDSAMAQQNFQNSLAGLRANMDAGRGEVGGFAKRDPRDPGVQRNDRYRPPEPTQPRPSGQDFIDSRDQNTRYDGPKAPGQPRPNFTQERLMGAPVNQGPIPGGNMQFPNLSKEEIDNLNNPNGYWKGKDQGFLQFASPSDIQLRWNDIPQAQKEELAARYQPSPMQGAMASQPQVPQPQQMQNYQNLLQQGIQRSNTMNQDASTNFANMQAGAPTTQPAVPATSKPTMPVAGIGMQKSSTAPRKFSTVNTPSARFG